MTVRYFNKDSTKEMIAWDKFVCESPQGSIFSKSWYLDALKANYKILTIIKDEKILAGIVLAKDSLNTYSNPKLDKYLGILFALEKQITSKSISKQYKLIEILAKELKKYRTFNYYFHSEFKNWIPLYWNNYSQQTRYTYRIELNNSIDVIKSKFQGNVKNDINNAIRQNIKIISNIEYKSFYHIINKTFQRQGSRVPLNYDKLKHFIDEVSKQNKFVTFAAQNENNEIISVCGLVYDNKSTYLLLNGIDIDKHIRGANSLMIFESIKYFQNKCIFYDFEGSMIKGIESFYRKFGGELVPYMHIWNDNLVNYCRSKIKKFYKKIRFGR